VQCSPPRQRIYQAAAQLRPPPLPPSPRRLPKNRSGDNLAGDSDLGRNPDLGLGLDPGSKTADTTSKASLPRRSPKSTTRSNS
jgi:hypothetical protein